MQNHQNKLTTPQPSLPLETSNCHNIRLIREAPQQLVRPSARVRTLGPVIRAFGAFGATAGTLGLKFFLGGGKTRYKRLILQSRIPLGSILISFEFFDICWSNPWSVSPLLGTPNESNECRFGKALHQQGSATCSPILASVQPGLARLADQNWICWSQVWKHLKSLFFLFLFTQWLTMIYIPYLILTTPIMVNHYFLLKII